MYKNHDWSRDTTADIYSIIKQSAEPMEPMDHFDHCYTDEQDGRTTYMGWNFIPDGGLGRWLDDVDLILDDLMTAGYRIHYSIEPHEEVALSEHDYPGDVLYFEISEADEWV